MITDSHLAPQALALPSKSTGAERAEITGRRPLGDKRAIMSGDVLDNVIRNFSRQGEAVATGSYGNESGHAAHGHREAAADLIRILARSGLTHSTGLGPESGSRAKAKTRAGEIKSKEWAVSAQSALKDVGRCAPTLVQALSGPMKVMGKVLIGAEFSVSVVSFDSRNKTDFIDHGEGFKTLD